MEKNDEIVMMCEALGTNGEGIARLPEATVFVPGFLPGERAKVRILKTKGRIAYGKVIEVYTPAEERVRPVCPIFLRCGGCQLQHMSYRMQIRYKTGLVGEALRKIGGIEYRVPSCVRSDKEYGYRNKLQLPIGRADGENAIGFYRERSHRIVRTMRCPIHPEWAQKVIEATYRFMEKCGLDGYDEQTGSGQLRHIVVRELRGKYLVTLVSTERTLKGIDYFLHLLDGVFSEYSFYLNYHPTQDNVVFGKEFQLLKGKGSYTGTASGISYEAGPATFLQVNDGVRNGLYDKALSFTAAGDTVIDCYAGGGLLTAMFARKCGRAYGLEIVPEAVSCADRLAENNGLKENMTNLCGDVKELLPALLERERGAVVVLDPPRAGLERSVVDLLIRCAPEKIIMISCNPATLARDLGLLLGTLADSENGLVKTGAPTTGYQISYLQPFDMFPQTKHVETLVLLSKKKPDSHIVVDVEFGEGEGKISLKH